MCMTHISFLCFSCLFLFGAKPCNAQESNAIKCADGVDNDGDGLIDCQDEECLNLSNWGCLVCDDPFAGYADTIINYQPGCSDLNFKEPRAALGLADWSDPKDGRVVLLGEGGQITLGFKDRIVSNSGDENPDIWIFEVGEIVEPCRIWGKPYGTFTENLLNGLVKDEEGFYDLGLISDTATYIDFDVILKGFSTGQLHFQAIKIVDVPELDCSTTINPGADIDAVCAHHLLFLDCAGLPGGTAQINPCGVCMAIDHPAFENCVDCRGILGGKAVFDDCGNCLLPNDPKFNIACKTVIGIPNVFSPNGDGVNDFFQFVPGKGVNGMVISYRIFDRWGSLVYDAINFDLHSESHWWDGGSPSKSWATGIFIYQSKIAFENGVIHEYHGEVLKLSDN